MPERKIDELFRVREEIRQQRFRNSIGESRRFLETLLLILVVLKLAGLIDLSWWLVTLPFTAPLGLALAFIAVALLRRSRRSPPCG